MVQRAVPRPVLHARRDHQVELPSERLVEHLQEPEWQQPAMTTEVRAPPRGDRHPTDGFAFSLPTDLRDSGIIVPQGWSRSSPPPVAGRCWPSSPSVHYREVFRSWLANP